MRSVPATFARVPSRGFHAIVLVAAALASGAASAQRAHGADCATLDGIRKARCERHEKMYDKCHPIKGEAHHECDRQFLIANPLDCALMSGRDADLCAAERDAVAVCQDETGRAFFKCAAARLKIDPRH